MTTIAERSRIPRRRLFRFGLVGLGGMAVNQAAVYLSHEHLFGGVLNVSLRLNLSMAMGILIGMISSFCGNRRWTWQEIKETREGSPVRQFARYGVAGWAGVLVQVIMSNLLTSWMPYLLANQLGIATGCLVNFIHSDLWMYPHVRIEGIDPEAGRLRQTRVATLLIAIGVILAICTYFYGLDSLHILRNGDELVYIHITRITAMTHQWLPLQSEMADMRNTKPPLLFWQGLLSTHWGKHWSLAALRWPSLLWTFGTAFLCGLLGWRLTGRDPAKGVLAALFFLAFFTTYRYGRPFLTNPPETFWVFASFFTLLWWKPRSFDSRFLFPTILGLLGGMALLTKSFAQLLPIAVGLLCWHLHVRSWRPGPFVGRSLTGIAWTSLLSLCMFSLWFVLDPEPEAIWREFVVKENMGKMGSGLKSWLEGLLWGGDNIWRLAGSWFANAGLLAFPLLGVMVQSWRDRQTLHDGERLLWIWVFVIFLVFSIPSERSGRYLLEGMPALAVLMATRSHHVWRWTFVATLASAIVVLIPLGWVSLLLANEVGAKAFPWWHLPLVMGAALFAGASIARPRWTAMCTPAVVLSVFLSLASFLSVFDPPLGAFGPAVTRATADRVAWVPEGFRSVAELYRFLLPGAVVRGYPAEEKAPRRETLGPDDFVVIKRPLDSPAPADAVGSRISIAGRHSAREIREMIMGRVKEHLFVREWVVPARSLPMP